MPPSSPTGRTGSPSRARRVLGVIGAVVGTTVTFVTATAAAAVIHLDVPATRRLVATQVNRVLHDQFAGDVTIESIGGLSLRGIDGVSARVRAPGGQQVLHVQGVRVRVRSLEAARSFLFGKGDILVPVDLASIDHIDAAIDGDAAGNLQIANAFAERTPTPSKPSDPNARGVRVEAPQISLQHAWVHGQAPGAPPVDAELHRFAAQAHYDPKSTRAQVDHVDLVTRGLPRGVDPRGGLSARFAMPSATGQDMSVDASFDGAVARIPTTLQARMDGQKIDVVVDGHDVAGQGMRATFGEVGIQEEVTLHAEAHGELPRIDAKAHVSVGRGTVDVDGDVDLSDGTKAKATIAARHIDAHAIVSSAPVSDLGFDSRAEVVIAKSGAISGDVTIETQPGTMAGERLPIVKAKADFTKETAHATGRILDPRATADFAVDMRTAGGDQIAEGQVRAEVPDLSKLPQVGANMKGHATITADGTVNLGTKAIAARVHVLGGKIAYDANTVDDVRVLATARGTMDHPVVDVGVHSSGLTAGEQKVGTADVRARIEPGAVTTIRDAQVDMVREGLTISATATRVQVGGPRMSVEGAVVTGLGKPIKADVFRDASELRVNVDGPSIDLRRVAVLAGKRDAVRSGTLSFGGDVAFRRDGAKGELHAKVDSFSGFDIEKGNVSVDASFAGKAVGLNVKADLGDAGRFELVSSDVVIGGSPIDPKSWQRIEGHAKFDADIDMERAASLVPQKTMPFSELRGRVVLAGVIRRDSADVPPELSIHAHTRGFVIAGKAAAEAPLDVVHDKVVSGVQPWRSEGVDGTMDAKVDAMSGHAELAFRVYDAKGTLVGFDAKSLLPYQQIVAEPSRVMELVKSAPISVKVVVPKRALSDLPALAGMRNVPGTVEAELDVQGTVLMPRVAFAAHGRGVRSPTFSPTTAADADVDFTYDGEKGDVVAKVGADGREALEMTAHVDLRARDLLEPKPGQELAWGGSAKAKLTSLPLGAVGPLADRNVRGAISGEAVIEDLHKDAKLHAEIVLDDVKVARARFKSGKISVDARDGKLVASARIDQTDGYVDLEAKTGIHWGKALAPSLDEKGKLDAHLQAKAFRLAAAAPFLQSVVNGLDGRLDADAHVTIGPGLADPTMQGKITVREGTFQAVALGEEFKNARATITLLPGGQIKIDDVFMQGTDGELTANAEVRTRGLRLGSATASLNIPKRKALDFSIGGQPLGEISGDVKVAATSSEDGKTMSIKVDVPTLDIALPQKLKSGIQELAPPKSNIRVGTFRDPRTFVKLPLDHQDLEPPAADKPVGTVLDVAVNLGTITIGQGNTAKVSLGGNPHIRITNRTEVTGQIQIKEGQIDVMGKKFEIERGTITFQPNDAANPVVVATAGWTAADGSKIYADFVGPVKTGKVNLRSDPARARNEIVAMILFGTADGANAPPPPNNRAPNGTTKAAASLGGGFAAQGLTEAMDDLAGIEATARIDTTRSANPAPEVEVQLSRSVSIAFAHVLGTPPLSQPDTNLAIVEWRFRRNWSLETTVGDKGKLQTDAIWTKRY